MEFFINIFEPTRIYQQTEFPQLLKMWKSGDYVEGAVSIATNFKYFEKNFITIAPMDLWTSQYVNGIRQLLSFDSGTSKSAKWRTATEMISEFHQKYPTKKGTFYEMCQSGHSLILQMGMGKLKNTIRSYIYAETILLPFQISMTRKMAAKFFNIYTNEKSVIIPDSLSVFLKRDPVLWMGGLVSVREIVFVDKPNLEAIGICPLVMDAMNADIDGDTIIMYIVESDLKTRNQQDILLSPYVWGIFGSRWSPTTSHLQLIFFEMVSNYFPNVMDLDNNENIKSKFQECLDFYDGKIFGEFQNIFILARKQAFGLYNILRRMLILSYYENSHWKCIEQFNKLVLTGKMISITNFTQNSLFFAIIEFTKAASYKNENFFHDFQVIKEKGEKDYLFEECPEQFRKKMKSFRSEYINSSSDLPKQSYQISLLLNNVQSVKYRNGNIEFDDHILIEDLANIVSLEDFVDSKGLEIIVDSYCLENKII